MLSTPRSQFCPRLYHTSRIMQRCERETGTGSKKKKEEEERLHLIFSLRLAFLSLLPTVVKFVSEKTSIHRSQVGYHATRNLPSLLSSCIQKIQILLIPRTSICLWEFVLRCTLPLHATVKTIFRLFSRKARGCKSRKIARVPEFEDLIIRSTAK